MARWVDARPDADDDGPAPTVRCRAASTRGRAGRPKVLLVDDRRDNLLALEAILQGLPVEPVAVDSGEAALKRLLIDDFAVILLDAQMPDMDGFETATPHQASASAPATYRSSS